MSLMCVLRDAETLERHSWQKALLKCFASSAVKTSSRLSGLAGGVTTLFHLQSGCLDVPDPCCDVTPAWTSAVFLVLAIGILVNYACLTDDPVHPIASHFSGIFVV